ncbi:MAG: DUF1848 domain-containing protein [Chloroflexi bacterium]|nr:DUF1848 domain-containing protein [Chloroflexota bacterium]
MIISASYKTDIPTFYGDWFINRLNAGYCKMVNPYNGQAHRVSLGRDDVDAFVFWTKNLGPFIDKLTIVHQRGYPFIVQYTINAYPRSLEFSVVNSERSIEHMKRLVDAYGSKVAVWRYDPILISSVTTVDFHRQNFAKLAKALEGTTDEVVVSFAQLYKKTARNMNEAADKFEFTWQDPSDDAKLSLAEDLAQIAKAHSMQLTMCSQKQFLAPGVEAARCVDTHRLSEMAGYPINAQLKGNRPDCGCFASKDIGEYDTCPHGCVYCYAVINRKLAQRRYKEHDPESEFLFTPERLMPNTATEEILQESNNRVQMKLF